MATIPAEGLQNDLLDTRRRMIGFYNAALILGLDGKRARLLKSAAK